MQGSAILQRSFGVAACVIPFLVVILAPISSTSAHSNHGPTLGERYLKLDISVERVRTIYGLTYGSKHAAGIRSAADGDSDGVVSAEESETYGQLLLEQLVAEVSLDINGEPTVVRWGGPVIIGLAGAGARGPVTIEVTGSTDLPPGTERFVLRDSAEFDGVYRTTATLATTNEVTLIRGGEGLEPRTCLRRVAYLDFPEDGPPPARILSALVRGPAVAEPLQTRSWSRGSVSTHVWGAGLLLSAVVVMIVWRRRRRVKATGRGRDNGH